MAEEKENCENFQTCNKPLCFNPADKKCSRFINNNQYILINNDHQDHHHCYQNHYWLLIRCRLVHYCSLQCMKACWPKHKLECRWRFSFILGLKRFVESFLILIWPLWYESHYKYDYHCKDYHQDHHLELIRKPCRDRRKMVIIILIIFLWWSSSRSGGLAKRSYWS